MCRKGTTEYSTHCSREPGIEPCSSLSNSLAVKSAYSRHLLLYVLAHPQTNSHHALPTFIRTSIVRYEVKGLFLSLLLSTSRLAIQGVVVLRYLQEGCCVYCADTDNDLVFENICSLDFFEYCRGVEEDGLRGMSASISGTPHDGLLGELTLK